MATITQEEIFTLGDLAARFGVSPHRVKYALESRLIQPVRWIAGARIWSSVQLAEIQKALADVRRINLDKGAVTNAREPIQT